MCPALGSAALLVCDGSLLLLRVVEFCDPACPCIVRVLCGRVEWTTAVGGSFRRAEPQLSFASWAAGSLTFETGWPCGRFRRAAWPRVVAALSLPWHDCCRATSGMHSACLMRQASRWACQLTVCTVALCAAAVHPSDSRI
jgi:hypothetical protein